MRGSRSLPVTGVALLALLLAPCLLHAAPAARGEQSTVTGPSPYSDVAPAVAAADGGYLVVWTNRGDGLDARFVDSAGRPAGEEIHLAANDPFPQRSGRFEYASHRDPAVVALQDGGYMVVWSRVWESLSYAIFHVDREVVASRVVGLLLDADGVPVGEAFPVSPAEGMLQGRPAVSRLVSGDLAVVWEEREPGSTETRVRGMILNPLGAPLGSALALHDGTASGAARPTVTATPEGGFLAAWAAPHGAGTGIVIRAYDTDGAPLGPVRTAHPPVARDHYLPTFTAAADGGFALAWYGIVRPGIESRIFARKVSERGEPRGPVVQLGDAEVSHADTAGALVARPDGGFTAFWLGWRHRFPQWVVGQDLDADLRPTGDVFAVSEERPQGQLSLGLATTPTGFYLAWEGFRSNRSSVVGRAYGAEPRRSLGVLSGL